MSTSNIPSPAQPEPTNAAAATAPSVAPVTTVPAGMTPTASTAPVAPTKSKGLSTFNRLATVLALVLIATTATFFGLTVKNSRDIEEGLQEAADLEKQTAALVAPRWCGKVTADSIDDMPSIYEEFDDASIIVQNAIKAECPKRVDIAQAVTSYDADSNIKAQDSTCAVNESETSVSCTTTVTVTNEVLKEKLSAFSSTTATLKIWFDDNQFVTFKPKHTTENVATVTLDTSGTATVTFETPYESGWGDRYGIDVASYFPNE